MALLPLVVISGNNVSVYIVISGNDVSVYIVICGNNVSVYIVMCGNDVSVYTANHILTTNTNNGITTDTTNHILTTIQIMALLPLVRPMTLLLLAIIICEHNVEFLLCISFSVSCSQTRNVLKKSKINAQVIGNSCRFWLSYLGPILRVSVKSPLGLVLYYYFNMPTINKTYFILSYLTKY
jgi:hypothetical protein